MIGRGSSSWSCASIPLALQLKTSPVPGCSHKESQIKQRLTTFFNQYFNSKTKFIIKEAEDGQLQACSWRQYVVVFPQVGPFILYLFISKSELHRGGDSEFFHSVFHSPVGHLQWGMGWAKIRRQELHPSLPVGYRGLNSWAMFCCFSKAIFPGREQDQK